MTAPNIVKQLVQRFLDNREAYLSSGYKEAQLRQEFINPFFEGLGWDVQNRGGSSELYKDVVHEEAIKIGGMTKAPDYSFRIGGRAVFFVEVKKPSVRLKDDPDAAFQLRRYAWSAKLPVSILTDFEEFAVYDTRVQPRRGDKASVARVQYHVFAEYESKWDELAGLFSKEAVLQGGLDRFVQSKRLKKGTAEVDRAFLIEIEKWRSDLAKNLAARNPRLDVRSLNFAVQRIIDRIVFLRICEDRGVETYGQLQALENGTNVYERLKEIFERADDRYNSGLFHFRADKDRHEPPDELTLRLKVDDEVLKGIIAGLYYPRSPYEFSFFPADILGQVYEQFLGKVIRLTEGHQARVEDKPEVKKAGGVYYTPTYIVEYIVKHTVGSLLNGKTPKEASKVTILDPACGSGSFLIGAYQHLLDWHLDLYLRTGAEKHKKELFQGPGGAWRLTTTERKRILLNNIYGVDIDPQAVEVTKLSLLLKVLEGQTAETINQQLKLFHERALPDLEENIKCGNSLIGTDFYQGQQFELLDDDYRLKVNAFDWSRAFPNIIQSVGGFSAVVGNPPWGADFSQDELAYFRQNYARVIARMIDSYIYFLDRAVRLAKSDGLVGFIVPATLLNQVDAQPARGVLLDRGVRVLVNLGQGVFAKGVTNTSAILVSGSQNDQDSMIVTDVAKIPPLERQKALRGENIVRFGYWKAAVIADPHCTYFTGGLQGALLLGRLRQAHSPFNAILDGAIERGVSPDVVAAHVLPLSRAKKLGLESGLLRPAVSGKLIKRYEPWTTDEAIIYTTRDTPIQQFPKCLEYLRQYKEQNTCKEVVEGKHPWWALHRPRDPMIFASPKFIGLTTTRAIELVYDERSGACVTDAMYVFRTRGGVDPWILLAVLQSKTFLFLYRTANQGEARVIPQVKASKLQDLPVPALTSAAALELRQLVLTVHQLNVQKATFGTAHEQQVVGRQVTAIEEHIDHLVFKLYGLTDAEIRMVEHGTGAQPQERTG